jgi:hypothetical protein
LGSRGSSRRYSPPQTACPMIDGGFWPTGEVRQCPLLRRCWEKSGHQVHLPPAAAFLSTHPASSPMTIASSAEPPANLGVALIEAAFDRRHTKQAG